MNRYGVLVPRAVALDPWCDGMIFNVLSDDYQGPKHGQKTRPDPGRILVML